MRKKGRDKKQQHVTAIGGPEVEVESVDEDAEPPEKEVKEEDANGDGGQDDQEEVSMDSWAHATLTELLGGWPQWTSAWAWPPRTVNEEGYNAWPIDDDVWPSHCQIQASRG